MDKSSVICLFDSPVYIVDTHLIMSMTSYMQTLREGGNTGTFSILFRVVLRSTPPIFTFQLCTNFFSKLVPIVCTRRCCAPRMRRSVLTLTDPATPTPCPFNDAYYFRYSDHVTGSCDQTISYAKPCVGHTKYLLHFKQCTTRDIVVLDPGRGQ